MVTVQLHVIIGFKVIPYPNNSDNPGETSVPPRQVSTNVCIQNRETFPMKWTRLDRALRILECERPLAGQVSVLALAHRPNLQAHP